MSVIVASVITNNITRHFYLPTHHTVIALIVCIYTELISSLGSSISSFIGPDTANWISITWIETGENHLKPRVLRDYEEDSLFGETTWLYTQITLGCSKGAYYTCILSDTIRSITEHYYKMASVPFNSMIWETKGTMKNRYNNLCLIYLLITYVCMEINKDAM